MADVVLTTLNARYAHASFGLRYLMANLPDGLRARAVMMEFDISQRAVDVLEKILAQRPRVVGVGVYIWNARESAELVAALKRVRPDVIVVLGGPEVSYETEQQAIVRDADHVITGEADLAFGDLCAKLLAGQRPLMKVVAAELPEFEEEQATERRRGRRGKSDGATERRSDEGERDEATKGEAAAEVAGTESGGDGTARTDDAGLPVFPSVASSLRRSVALPYHLYTDTDLARRVVYVEASRGCPFKCEFCLSSLDVPVRNVAPDDFLGHMGRLLERGLRQFKFVDRTFNLNLNVSRRILEFFLERYEPGMFLHFEMIPDRLPEALRGIIARFPAGALQFEVGIQTFNPDVAQRISRRQDYMKLADNLTFLRQHTSVHVHADLIVGLPGEDADSFGRGFDQLVALRPQEIQVGLLKRLRGTPIVRHDAAFGMIYSPHPPYEVLETAAIDFATMQRLRRFARYWDLIANSGNFLGATPLIWSRAGRVGEAERAGESPSPFEAFLMLSDWLFARAGQAHGIALVRLYELLFEWLAAGASGSGEDASEAEGEGASEGAAARQAEIARVLGEDYQRGGRSDVPAFLRQWVGPADTRRVRPADVVPRRQRRHLAG
ncbi:MAG TPA: DUF4080 domain-containing protein [Tepidisphaeraceae bacterium]|nr:DUF4080 domain-containing protein [Tepidisphaeraceae bacterium]